MNIRELDSEYIAGTYARFPVELVRGKGARFYDETGKEYIDLGSGIAVNTFGAADDVWVAAVTEQLGKLQHTSNLYYTEPCARLAEMLCKRTGMKKVFFGNSGAEANECAIKAARKYAADKQGKKTPTIITLKNSFHGRTITTLAATGQDTFHHDFLPLTEGFVYGEANNLDDIRRLAEEYDAAAIMVEFVQGEGGVLPLTQEFVTGIAQLAKERGMLLIADEVQTGNGRTGELYAYMHYGVTPDIVTTAKGLGGGLPIGATMFAESTADVLTAGTHGSTFGGNPVVCAGACNILERIDDALLSDVREKSAMIFGMLEGAKGVRSVSGLGLMIGIETEKDAGEVLAACRARGVLALKAKNKVRLLPPLNIDKGDLKKAIEILKACCVE